MLETNNQPAMNKHRQIAARNAYQVELGEKGKSEKELLFQSFSVSAFDSAVFCLITICLSLPSPALSEESPFISETVM